MSGTSAERPHSSAIRQAGRAPAAEPHHKGPPVTDTLPGAEPKFTELAADIVSAYVAKNSVRPADLPELIAAVHGALRNLANPAAKEAAPKLTPPVNPKKSITPDHLISLEDGRRYKSLRRHLRGRGLTPEQYRAKWGLPHDYPMVAPNYAKTRSELAKKLGLGRLRSKEARKPAAAPAPAPKKRGRKQD
jgi:predicted transcriptional regulator